ncbi:SDR family oxidoreductase [Pseudothauera rhizosphaerae]|uniref:SDR family oxidoreductase n=1 Tax=Pseudothauera rhizosphaerae TaxID=2565932 RepID=UPI001B3B271A|nr:SDR family oxidoreductase [Pseudothauera rhizosphaerae]
MAIVTGGSRGIGRRIAERLAQTGYAVLIGYRSEQASADEAAAGIAAIGGTARAVRADVADEAVIARLFDTAEREFGGIDVVVNAAGVLIDKPLADLNIDEVDRMLGTNLRGAVIVSRQAARRVRAGGSIINISSAITKGTAPGYSVYAATKAGLEALTATLAKELGGRGIRVNAVAPGPTDTDMLRTGFANSGHGEQMRQAIVSATPLGRIGRPDDAAEVVLALVGPLRWVHGQTIHASGGLV